MEIKIYGKHLDVTPAIDAYIREKFSHIHKPEKLNQVEFKIGIEKEKQYVHFDAYVLHENIHIESHEDNLYASIDSISNKIKQTFVKLKEKKNIHLKH